MLMLPCSRCSLVVLSACSLSDATDCVGAEAVATPD